MKIYKIYCLKHPITLEIRYIGITIKELKERLYQHKYVSKNKKVDTHVAKWINSLLQFNLLPIIELIENCNEDNWQEREIYWISYYSNLTNISKGGMGLILNRKESGKNNSIKAHKKAISILNKDFSLVKHCESINEASIYLKVCRTAIGHVLNGQHTNVKGFLIVKQNDFINKNFKEYKGKTKDVYQYDLLGNLLEKFPSLSSVYHKNNEWKTNHIDTACKNLWKHKGFFWSYTPLNNINEIIKVKRNRKNIKI